jgi:hexosaminidase
MKYLISFSLIVLTSLSCGSGKRNSRNGYTNSIGMEFVRIPAGTFSMGSGEGKGEKDETPVRRVIVSRPFYLGKYEVTQKQWLKVMGTNPSFFNRRKLGSRFENHPVEQVSFRAAREFVRKLNLLEKTEAYRLPTEAEWEYACRAGTGTLYPFGDREERINEYAWNILNSGMETHPVGSRKSNPWGLYDMSGNVWEFCQDRYDEGFYSRSPIADPFGPPSGETRVLRGGAWDTYPEFCRSAFRLHAGPDYAVGLFFGLRLVREVEPSSKVKPVALIPKPAVCISKKGTFRLDDRTVIRTAGTDPDTEKTALFLRQAVLQATGLDLPIVGSSIAAGSACFELALDGGDPSLVDEGYRLEVNERTVKLRAAKPAGLFYAVQTLRQLLPDPTSGEERSLGAGKGIPCLDIEDRPRFRWRGVMLDPARHFLSTEFIKRYIDLLAFHKFNVLHLHLTDNEGWRLAIGKYPDLTRIGARLEGQDAGFYSRGEMEEIIRYAAERFVLIVPEVEMPGHSEAVLSVFPELSCTGKPPFHAFCMGNDKALSFFKQVLAEVADIFPGPYIHIGGDEVNEGNWEKCPLCRARMEKEGIKEIHGLQTWFMRRITDFLALRNRRAMSWAVTRGNANDPQNLDDIGHNSLVHSWHDEILFAAPHGFDVINSNFVYTYLDYPEFTDKRMSTWMGATDLSKVYSFSIVPPGFSPEQAEHVWGSTYCLWGEMATQSRVDRASFPRLLAGAERLWSGDGKKDFAEFFKRVIRHEKRLKAMGVDSASLDLYAKYHD